MDWSYLKEHWVRGVSPRRQEDLWNREARNHARRPLPTAASSGFLQQLAQWQLPEEQASVLDIGCGAGGYALALAGRVRSVTGCDISPAMIQAARERAAALSCRNATFVCEDWATADVDAPPFRQGFDLVMARKTPAIADLDSFLKLLRCARRHCVWEGCVRRHNNLLEQVRPLVEGEDQRPAAAGGQDAQVAYIFSCLWQLGFCPRIAYREERWHWELLPDEAADWCLGRMALYREVPAQRAAAVRQAIRDMSNGQAMVMTMTDTAVTLYWDMRDRADAAGGTRPWKPFSLEGGAADRVQPGMAHPVHEVTGSGDRTEGGKSAAPED